MPKKTPPPTYESVLIDTSFLITLADDTRANHEVAKKYYKDFIRRGITMYLSTIVISEFQQMQPVTDLMVSGNYMPLPFNFEDAIKTAEVAFNLGGTDRRGESRSNCKDDIKLIGQAEANGISLIITDDSGTLFRFCDKLHKASIVKVKPIKLDDGHDSALFNNGQATLV